jgi:hypothetical protein
MSVYGQLPKSILEGLRDFIQTYTELKSGAPVWVEYLGNDPTEYAVLPLAGPRVLETYITGKRVMSYPFALQSMESTAGDLERLETAGFYEAFAEWLDAQTDQGVLPDLPEGKTPEVIEALGWGYLYQDGESMTGVYQVQCQLIYTQVGV